MPRIQTNAWIRKKAVNPRHFAVSYPAAVAFSS
jgi:hypothetical protein